jgi:hypothetical protein
MAELEEQVGQISKTTRSKGILQRSLESLNDQAIRWWSMHRKSMQIWLTSKSFYQIFATTLSYSQEIEMS